MTIETAAPKKTTKAAFYAEYVSKEHRFIRRFPTAALRNAAVNSSSLLSVIAAPEARKKYKTQFTKWG